MKSLRFRGVEVWRQVSAADVKSSASFFASLLTWPGRCDLGGISVEKIENCSKNRRTKKCNV